LTAKTVAVLYFDNNTGARDYDNLGRGMASMMITDLSAMKDVRSATDRSRGEFLA